MTKESEQSLRETMAIMTMVHLSARMANGTWIRCYVEPAKSLHVANDFYTAGATFISLHVFRGGDWDYYRGGGDDVMLRAVSP